MSKWISYSFKTCCTSSPHWICNSYGVAVLLVSFYFTFHHLKVFEDQSSVLLVWSSESSPAWNAFRHAELLLCVAILYKQFLIHISQTDHLEIKVDEEQNKDMHLSEQMQNSLGVLKRGQKLNSNSLDTCTGGFITTNECNVLLDRVHLNACAGSWTQMVAVRCDFWLGGVASARVRGSQSGLTWITSAWKHISWKMHHLCFPLPLNLPAIPHFWEGQSLWRSLFLWWPWNPEPFRSGLLLLGF